MKERDLDRLGSVWCLLTAPMAKLADLKISGGKKRTSICFLENLQLGSSLHLPLDLDLSLRWLLKLRGKGKGDEVFVADSLV